MSEEATKQVEEFDPNDPSLGAVLMDEIDPNALPVRIAPAPPDDGEHNLVLRLRDDRQGGAVYIKGKKDPVTGKPFEVRLVACIAPRFLNEDGSEGGYLKDWYATTYTSPGQKAHAISGLCLLAGRPYDKTVKTMDDQKAWIETLFYDAGEEGIAVRAKTRWVKSFQRVDDSGMPVFDENDKKVYDQIVGQKKIIRLAVLEAKDEVKLWSPKDNESTADFEARKKSHVDSAPSRAHIFADPVSGDERQVQCEVVELVESED